VLSWEPIDVEPINRYYGTRLDEREFERIVVPRLLRYLIAAIPARLAQVKASVLLRRCKEIQHRFDLVLTANNESDLGRPGIQYVHFPWAFRPRPDYDLSWYHLRRLLRLYYSLCVALAGFSFDAMKANLTLVNSDWTGERFAERHGARARTVPPPVHGTFPDVPWEEREDGFVCMGRIAPEKELEKVVAIVGRVREQVPSVRLHLVGTPVKRGYFRRIQRLVRANASWLSLHVDPSREELAHLVSRQRYGLHGMSEEHFGIAAAEMMNAGCIVFVPKGGGQREIVGDEDRLLYVSAEDAVRRIVNVLLQPSEQRDLREYLARRRECFTTARFVRTIREIVDSWPSDGGPRA
jgi:glycosyltransferase involved in cell wall biosynthesis